jgi:Lon protease-like protein
VSDEIALFPLSNVVLFPKVQTPLHLFEPRYRQLCEHVLAGSRRIGMVAVPPEHAGEMAGDPPVHAVGCAGAIGQHQRLPDGRYNIVLIGLHRFRILEELPPARNRLYRVARIERLEDPLPAAAEARVVDLRARIVRIVGALVSRSDPARAAAVTPELFGGVDDATFVNSLCSAFAFPAPERQALLEAPDIPARYERLEGLLSFRLAEIDARGAARSSRVH